MRISLIIPTLWVKPESVIVPMLQSVSGMYDELLIIDSPTAKLSEKINEGLKKTTGDYIVVSNDDLTINTGTLKDLCEPMTVNSPRLTSGSGKIFHAHMWCMDRKVYERIGGMDEDFVIYWMDTDYSMRLKEAGITTKIHNGVVVDHNHPATTMATLAGNLEQQDEQTFIKKYGKRIHDPLV